MVLNEFMLFKLDERDSNSCEEPTSRVSRSWSCSILPHHKRRHRPKDESKALTRGRLAKQGGDFGVDMALARTHPREKAKLRMDTPRTQYLGEIQNELEQGKRLALNMGESELETLRKQFLVEPKMTNCSFALTIRNALARQPSPDPILYNPPLFSKCISCIFRCIDSDSLGFITWDNVNACRT